MATHQLRPANDTVSARLAARRPSSQPPMSRDRGAGSRGDLLLGQRAEQPQQIGDPLGVAGGPVVGEVLQLAAGGGDDVGVEQLAQLDPAEQLGQQRAVQRERRGPAFGQRGVALVHEGADVAEQQRRGERRGPGGLGLQHPDSSALGDAGHQLHQGGDVVDVLQAFPDGFQHDGEVGVLAGHLQQLGGALALVPQRRAAAGVSAGQQQGAGRALPEPRREQRRTAHFGGDDRVDLVGIEDEQLRARRGVSSVRTKPVSGNRTTMPSSEAVGFSSMP